MKEDNANSIGERFSILVKGLKMNNNSFAKSVGKAATTINYIVEGKSKPGYDVLESVVKTYPQVNPNWLLTGEGEMVKSVPTAPVVSTDSYLVEHLHTLEENFNRLAKQLENKDKQIEGLQRTVDALISLPGKSLDVPIKSRVLPLWPELKKVG